MSAPAPVVMKENMIQTGLIALGLEGKVVEVHSSLSSFGHVEGGAETVVRALLNVCATVLVPTYSIIGATNPPENDRPRQNGWDYEDYRIPPGDVIPFDPDTFGVDSHIFDYLGIIPLTLLRTRGTIRSKHPSGSWSANGDGAADYLYPLCTDAGSSVISVQWSSSGRRDGGSETFHSMGLIL